MVRTLSGGGIPVRRKLNRGETKPTNSPLEGPIKSPATKTGRCIGKKILPAKTLKE
jgi:hypothetical protein